MTRWNIYRLLCCVCVPFVKIGSQLTPADITERAKVDEATPGDFEATFGVEARCTLYVNLAAVHIIQVAKRYIVLPLTCSGPATAS